MSGEPELINILIADDEPEIRELLRELLAADYRCVAVSSAEEALEKLRQQKFDLVLSDIMMGGMTGLEMIPHMLRQSPDTVVITISGMQTIESAIEALRVGAFDYLMKPFDIRHVEAAVKRALEHRRLLAAKRRYENHLEELVRQRTVELNKTNQTLSALIQASPLAIFVLDMDQRVKMWNPAAAHIFGWTDEEVLGRLSPICADRDSLTGEACDPTAGYFERKHVRKDGSLIDVSFWPTPLFDGAGVPHGTMYLVADITERRQAEARINYLAYHDTLTDLPNQSLFRDRVEQALNLSDPAEDTLAVAFLVPDRFEKINDTLGHSAGDRLLCEIARRLKNCLQPGDTVARWGGHEFALLLTQSGDAGGIAGTVSRIQAELRKEFEIDRQELYLTTSVGTSFFPQDGQNAALLLKNAGAALFRAKERGGDNFQFYRTEMNERALRRLSLENNLRRAIEREEFRLHFQPLLDVDGRKVTGMEALVRWEHPEMGLISPGEFIPLAEDTGLIIPLGKWILHAACSQNRKWQESAVRPLRISVNLSPRQFRQADLIAMVASTLEETGMDPRWLELELTESSLMDDAKHTVRALNSLREMGIRIAVDDFGSGYSSLNYLKHFPINVLKIDQSFVRDIASSQQDTAIVLAMVTLAHNLDLKVVAEGVETEKQLEALRSLGCDHVQGYLFSRPLPAPAFEKLISDLAARQAGNGNRTLALLTA